MSLKTFKSYTKSTRGTVLVDRKNLWKGKPLKSLTIGKHSTGGRNNLGRITSRHRGGGHKKKFRIIDFKRTKFDIPASVIRIEYDPIRTARIALIEYEDKTTLYEGLSEMWEWAKNQPKRERKEFGKFEVEKGIYDYWKK